METMAFPEEDEMNKQTKIVVIAVVFMFMIDLLMFVLILNRSQWNGIDQSPIPHSVEDEGHDDHH